MDEGAYDARDWRDVHRAIKRHAAERAEQEYLEGRLLLAAKRTRVWVHDACSTLAQYVERYLGYDGRMTMEKIRVAQALETLPRMTDELRAGKLCWSAVRELSRVATTETEEAWIAAARKKTVREIEELVAGLRRGDLPGDPPDPNLVRHVLRFEVLGERFAIILAALERRRIEAGRTQEEALEELVLAGEAALRSGKPESEDVAAPYQIALTRCVDCERAWIETQSGPVDVPLETVEKAECDGEVVDITHVGRPEKLTRQIPPKVRRFVKRRAGMRCEFPGCRSCIRIHIHHILPFSEGGTHDPENLVCLCKTHHDQFHDGFFTIAGAYSTGLTFVTPEGTERVRECDRNRNDPDWVRRFFKTVWVDFGITEEEARAILSRTRAIYGADRPEHQMRLFATRSALEYLRERKGMTEDAAATHVGNRAATAPGGGKATRRFTLDPSYRPGSRFERPGGAGSGPEG